ncbi:hypothetical protein V6N13_077508 [Hibiscus sabdariffa]
MKGHCYWNLPNNTMLSKLLTCSIFLFSFLCELPRNLTRLSNLKVIDLNRNGLGGKVNAEFSTLSRLQVLQLAGNNFIGTIPPSLGNISSLLYLSLAQNHLTGNIPTELGQLSNLKFFQLSLNELSGTVPKQLYNISSIYLFSVADNQLQGQIPPYLGLSLPNLEFISLAMNKFSGPIPTSIVNSSGLGTLDMSVNALTGPIPNNLGSLQNLQDLNFGNNLLESSNDLSFLTSLTNCTMLSSLFLYRNNLTGVLPDSIGNLSANLYQLWLGTNSISDQSITEQSISIGIRGTVGYIPPEYGMGQEISTHGDVYSYGIVLMELFTGKRPTDSMFTGELSLRQQRMRLKYRHCLPSRLEYYLILTKSSAPGNISSLLYLSLKQNYLEGNIPSELGQLSNLEFLQLSLNNLSGTIPKKLYNISSIYLFSLAEIQLQGQIPPYIGFSLPILESIYLGANKFSGPIPSSIVNSSRLVNLDMALNALSGPIPKNLGSLQNLQFLKTLAGTSLRVPMV